MVTVVTQVTIVNRVGYAITNDDITNDDTTNNWDNGNCGNTGNHSK